MALSPKSQSFKFSLLEKQTKKNTLNKTIQWESFDYSNNELANWNKFVFKTK